MFPNPCLKVSSLNETIMRVSYFMHIFEMMHFWGPGGLPRTGEVKSKSTKFVIFMQKLAKTKIIFWVYSTFLFNANTRAYKVIRFIRKRGDSRFTE